MGMCILRLHRCKAVGERLCVVCVCVCVHVRVCVRTSSIHTSLFHAVVMLDASCL